MSKRAEEAALRAYPFIPLPQYDLRDENPTDGNKIHRRIFLEGYEQAEKDINKEMIDWMEKYREKQEKALLAKHNYDIYIEQAEEDLGWISVKDRLPEEGHFVLTCVEDSGTPQCVGMALLLKDGTWWDGDVKVRVDYWMEVPKLIK